MNRMTQKDEQGNWCLKRCREEDFRIGKTLTKGMYEALCDALWRLKDYEDTELEPDEVRQLNDFVQSQAGIMLKKLNEEQRKHRWIPVEERLPEDETRTLVTFEDGFVTAADYYSNGWDLWADSGDVIAWMPLPEPYREEAEG